MTRPKPIPDSVWRGKFVLLIIGKERLKFPILSMEHYLRLKRFRDTKPNMGRS